jgi:MraZ protein
MFSGISSLSLDAKSRMTIPVRYREYLTFKNSNLLALVESNFGCLLLMPHSSWKKKVDGLVKNGTDEEKRFWIGLSDTPELDRSGRVLINSVLRQGAFINKEIILLGVGMHLEIWDFNRLEDHKKVTRLRLERSER